MNNMALYITKGYFLRHGGFLNILSKYAPYIYCVRPNYATTLDTIADNMIKSHVDAKSEATSLFSCFNSNETLANDDLKLLHQMPPERIDAIVMDTLRTKNDKKLEHLIRKCLSTRKKISHSVIFKLFQSYSFSGNVSMIMLLQDYCSKIDPKSFLRYGEYLHYVARAQCFKGNSDQGLTLLKCCYEKYDNLRSLYRLILRDLITDSVQNRSEASLVVFKRHILYYSEIWNDQYPILCFWHICWASTWFSDQMLANELLDSCVPLQKIVQDRAAAFSINILRNEFNDDAVTRLLQTLLKYKMIVEYAKVLQILFGYKLNNRDLRGCREILHHCESLGISLPASQQGKFINMIINKGSTPQKTITAPNNFKLKF